jgi:hypothetical protein
VNVTMVISSAGELVAALGGVAALILLLAGWLGRVWANRIAETDRAKVDAALAGVRHELDLQLERLRAELRSREDQLGDVRKAALVALSSGQAALNDRRLKAIDALWARVMALKSVSPVATALFETLRIEQAAKHTHEEPVQRLLAFIETLGAGFPAGLKGTAEASTARPYVTANAWLLYSAYSGIIALALVQLQALKARLDPLKFTKTDETLELVRTALPEFAKLVEDHGVAALPMLLPDLEERLLAELQASATGRASDAESVERVKKVAELVARREADHVKREAGL